MINTCTIMGRISNDLELKKSSKGNYILNFSVACERFISKDDKDVDFIRCVAFNKTAEFIYDYFSKGRMIAIQGNIRTGAYDDDNGTRHYTTDVIVEKVSFTGEPKKDDNYEEPPKRSSRPQSRNRRR